MGDETREAIERLTDFCDDPMNAELVLRRMRYTDQIQRDIRAILSALEQAEGDPDDHVTCEGCGGRVPHAQSVPDEAAYTCGRCFAGIAGEEIRQLRSALAERVRRYECELRRLRDLVDDVDAALIDMALGDTEESNG